MKGGFNKLMRNIVAGTADTEFEKVSPLQLLIIHLYIILTETDESYIPPGLKGAKRETCHL